MATQALGRQSIRRSIGELAPSLVVALVALQASVSLVLMQRRLAGALVDPGPMALLAAGLFAVALAAAPRAMARAIHPFPHSAWILGAVWFLPAIALLLAMLALSVPSAALGAIAVIWITAISSEAWFWTPIVREGAIRLRRNPRVAEPALRRAESFPAMKPVESGTRPREAAVPLDPHVWQQTNRAYAADGADVLRGTLRAVLAVGQRTANVHLAFCPPFARLPQLDYRQTDGPPARVKLGQLLPYGVRLDVKLDEPAEASSTVLLELTAKEARAEAKITGNKGTEK